jgi:arylformamidase
MMQRDSAWHDRMYNNRALVPDFADHFARWQQDSARVRADMRCVLDVPYGDGVNETLDIFPAAKPDAPVVVFIHGGYWRSLDKADHSFVAPALHALGACVVVVNYALCPGLPGAPVTVPDIALQMARALAWVGRHIGAHGGNAARVRVIGHSAGGHLAAMLMRCDWPAMGLPAHWLQGSLSISGLFDLEPIRKTPFLQADLRLTPEQVARVSPSGWTRPERGVFYSVVGGDESPEFLRQNQLIRRVWGARRVPVCEALPGLNHFSIMRSLVTPGSRLHALAAQMIAL